MRTLVSILLVVAVAASLLAIGGSLATAEPGSGPAASRPVGDTVAVTAKKRRCDRNYRGRCLRPNASDYDCAGGSGNGPYYVRGPFRVVGDDHYGLDSDNDGIACES